MWCLLAAILLLVPITAFAEDMPTAPRVGGTSRPLPEASSTRPAGQRCVLGVCTPPLASPSSSGGSSGQSSGGGSQSGASSGG